MLYNSNDIQRIIPHRFPFLLVDRILEINPEKTKIVGQKSVTAGEMCFMGHFPEKHVMPGVLIVEALAQTGAVLLLSREENKGKIALFGGINKVRFKHQVIPGDIMTLSVELTKERGNVFFAAVNAYVDDRLAVTGEIICAVEN
ncbi:MAG: 3-hydroxyacyl-ACP dehydratase FabZ [Peptostreptococcaceae bacterium]|nr:3-hydroxyacyl-ACP dehydratase FabZ [Peptostreptococcaceae bacterium]MDY5739342.1 3-hydroxyacyl-ACP dehydratase FabZ [Anaerovoracaceae bacterium]SFE50267.1 3-hydroxyacyl-[acyl-carrier-protein] dehydratase [Peptostreptococcaceae bacterium pGA-8]